MTSPRLGLLAVLCAGLAAGCSGGKATPAADPFGAVQARVATTPAGILSVLVTVSGPGIDVPVRAALVKDLDGAWSGRVVNVPPGLARVVTAYAYDHASPPADPVANVSGLAYRGSRMNVAVTAGQLAFVPVVLLPYPDGGGGYGVNTPPHLVDVTHPVSIGSNAATAFSATAIDPDDSALLTYQWSDDAGGTFSPPSGAIGNQLSGDAVSIDYTPPADLVGTVTIQLTVSDGVASASTSFPLGVGSGVDIGLQFDVLPEVTILAVQDQDLAPGGTSVLAYRLAYPAGAGPDAPTVLQGTMAWTDSCGGSFGNHLTDYTVLSGHPPQDFAVTYTAPATAPAAPGLCELRLTLADPLGATVWSTVFAWVTEPTVDITGTWSGEVADADFPGGTHTVTLALVQDGGSVSGSYTDQYGSAGAVTGIIDGLLLNYEIAVTSPCEGTLTGTATLDAGLSAMAFAYAGSMACNPSPSGSGTLAKSVVVLDGLVVFVTSYGVSDIQGGSNQIQAGSLAGDPANADAFCTARAAAGSGPNKPPPGTYVAFISSTGFDARDRIGDGRYILADGTLVANDKADLLDGTIQHGIDLNEFGAVESLISVWTGSDASGFGLPDNCTNWTSFGDGGPGAAGVSGIAFGSTTDASWAFAYSNQWCSDRKSLYCFQQPAAPPNINQ
jgi:hypothetical protein